ncbi:NAD(P)-binding protein [Eremomyces bilateralis CBS 781.70]|uniref:NAD(P)-binding protein n=1 Tax=Eremomyces bilateralis CBS 781.70 TaxID=1392243 RepID=A0A6G1FZU4_9PEZI|nr:NAD(P)-binding protein [Eremomyces bilateralis CBS 781.70]KAF1811313.1 NAD(P)-binding protein [Eremomyces bilateralis CBS 781.70]
MSSNRKFDVEKEIAQQSGRTFFITGGTAGLGAQHVRELAKKNAAHIYFSGRNAKRASEITESISKESPNTKLTFVQCDLADLASIKDAIPKANIQHLDVLVCNAGIMCAPAALTKDGYEIQFGTNHIGHALIIKFLLPCLLQTADQPNSDIRIVTLTSTGFKLRPSAGIEFDNLRTLQKRISGSWIRYGQSKLANILYADEIARRYPQILSVAIHPGVVKTNLVNDLPLAHRAFVHVMTYFVQLELHEGVYNQLWASAADKGKMTSGEMYVPFGVSSKEKVGDKLANDKELAKKLWDWTEKELEVY